MLKTQFPGAAGQGFAVPITATEEQINQLPTIIAGYIQIPSGTNMPFYQASPPAGWTATAIQNDSMMRVVTSATTGGASNAGGGQSPILNNTVPSHTHVFTGSALGTHTHAHTDPGHLHNSVGSGPGGSLAGIGAQDSDNTLNFPTSSATIGITIAAASAGTPAGTNAANAGAANWSPRYMDFCIGTKT